MALLAHIRAIHAETRGAYGWPRMRFETRRAAMDEVVDWLVFYNRKRLHSTLEYKSLITFEEIWRRQQNTLAA